MFKSPPAKLVKFFHGSRDSWKTKCQQAKCENKRLATQTRAVEKSRRQWKQKAQAARQHARALERELEKLKNTAGR